MKQSECTYSFLEAKQKIEAWCAYRDRCHHEVQVKLNSYGLNPSDSDALLAHLIEYRFVDEQRFAESFVSGKYRIKKWGRAKIKTELRKRFVPEVIITSSLKTIEPDIYWKNLLSLSTKKWKEKTGDTYTKTQKVKAFLYQKGYEYDLIEDALMTVIK